MNQQIEDIYTLLKQQYGLSKVEIERIINAQFKTLEENIKTRGNKVVNLIYLGKVKPSKYLLDNYDVLSKQNVTVEQRNAYRKDKGDKYRLAKLGLKEGTGYLEGENENM